MSINLSVYLSTPGSDRQHIVNQSVNMEIHSIRLIKLYE